MGQSIEGISYYLPQNTLTNTDLSNIFAVQEKDIFKKTGIKKRHVIDLETVVSDFAINSAEKLFQEYSFNKDNIDAIIFCSSAYDYKVPATACVLQNKLNLGKHIYTIDIRHGCTGYIYSLSVAKGLMNTSQANHVLIFTTEIPTSVIHPGDLELRMIFGDASAITYLCNKNNSTGNIGEFVFGTDGSGAGNLFVKYSGSVQRLKSDWLLKTESHGGMPYGMLEMNSVEIFTFTLREVPTLVAEVLKKNRISMDEIDLFIFHQANAFLLNMLRRKLKIPESKFYVYIEQVGNTVSASIPIALKEAIKEGKAKKGDKILLAAFGIGYSWCGTVITL
jgi:3-oxoacyl-[acyl-carrier-protein] synthase-3